LNAAKGYVKGLLADRVKLKFMPDIVFKIDDSYEKTKAIYDLLDKLKKEKKDERSSEGDKGK
jgi:ribosome-binding factor A